MRVAIFSETFLPKWDGVANTVCHLLQHLEERGWNSLVFAPQGAPSSYAGAPVVGLPCFGLPFYRELRLVHPLVDVEERLRAFDPDVIHVVNPAFLGLVGIRQARSLGRPVVASYHTDLPGYASVYGVGLFRETLWSYFRWIHNQADLTLCPSNYTLRQLEANGFERLGVWGRGVDAALYNPYRRSSAIRRRWFPDDPDTPILLYVGRLAAEKRLHMLRPVLDAIPEARLVLVGDGPLRQELEELFAGTATVFAGYHEGEALAEAYASGDIFVFPSNSETFGNVVLESMASGVPVVAADEGGPVDHVHDGVNGYLFDRDSTDHLIERVQYMMSHPVHRLELGLGARAYAERQSWGDILDGVLADYCRLAHAYPAAGILDERGPVRTAPLSGWSGSVGEGVRRLRKILIGPPA